MLEAFGSKLIQEEWLPTTANASRRKENPKTDINELSGLVLLHDAPA
jgi:hypothetical protein